MASRTEFLTVQPDFALYLDVSKDPVSDWEPGIKKLAAPPRGC